LYSFNLDFFKEVDKENSKWTLITRNIFLNIKKKERGPYWLYLTNDKQKCNHIHPDWNLYVEEDDEEEVSQPDFNSMGNSIFITKQ